MAGFLFAIPNSCCLRKRTIPSETCPDKTKHVDSFLGSRISRRNTSYERWGDWQLAKDRQGRCCARPNSWNYRAFDWSMQFVQASTLCHLTGSRERARDCVWSGAPSTTLQHALPPIASPSPRRHLVGFPPKKSAPGALYSVAQDAS